MSDQAPKPEWAAQMSPEARAELRRALDQADAAAGTGAHEVDMRDPKNWTQDMIAVKRKEGTFLKELKEYRNSLPGGSGRLFPSKMGRK